MLEGPGRVAETPRYGALFRAHQPHKHCRNDRRAHQLFGYMRARVQGGLLVQHVYRHGEVCAQQTLAHRPNDPGAQDQRQQCARRHCLKLYNTRVQHARAPVLCHAAAGRPHPQRHHSAATRASGRLVPRRIWRAIQRGQRQRAEAHRRRNR